MIEIDVTTQSLAAAFARAIEASEDLSDVMSEVRDTMIQRTQDNITAGVSPDGTSFAPRSDTTLRNYEKLGKEPGAHPLFVTGTMQGGISGSYGTDFAEWGSNAIQAAVMQFGAEQGEFGAWIGQDKNGKLGFSTIPWGDIPARPFLGIGQKDETALIEIIEGWLEEAFDG